MITDSPLQPQTAPGNLQENEPENTARQWRVGIIGCGYAGGRHAEALQALGARAAITAVADSDPGVARNQAAAWQVDEWVTDYHDLLTRDRLDAVSICLPHSLHCAAAVAAAEAGLHILIEKPLAASLAEADRMIAAAAQHNVCLMVAETVRFNATYQHVRELLQANLLGKLSLIRIHREHQMRDYLNARPWFLREPSGGILVSGGIHDFELVRMLAGEIAHVYALTPHKLFDEMTADDTGVVVAGLASGAVAMLVESFAIRTPMPGVHGIINGAEGSLWFSGDRIELYREAEDGHPEGVNLIHVPQTDPFEAEMRHFLDCLDDSTTPITSGVEQRKPLAAVEATYMSLERGARIDLL